MVLCLRIYLLMQGTQVRSLVWKDPTCHGAAKPLHHQLLSPCALEATLHKRSHHSGKPTLHNKAPQQRVDTACHISRKPAHRNEDPAQPKKDVYQNTFMTFELSNLSSSRNYLMKRFLIVDFLMVSRHMNECWMNIR